MCLCTGSCSLRPRNHKGQEQRQVHTGLAMHTICPQIWHMNMSGLFALLHRQASALDSYRPPIASYPHTLIRVQGIGCKLVSEGCREL